MARSHRPILDLAAGNLMLMIALHQDKPCPTNEEIMEWTGVPRGRLKGSVLIWNLISEDCDAPK